MLSLWPNDPKRRRLRRWRRWGGTYDVSSCQTTPILEDEWQVRGMIYFDWINADSLTDRSVIHIDFVWKSILPTDYVWFVWIVWIIQGTSSSVIHRHLLVYASLAAAYYSMIMHAISLPLSLLNCSTSLQPTTTTSNTTHAAALIAFWGLVWSRGTGVRSSSQSTPLNQSRDPHLISISLVTSLHFFSYVWSCQSREFKPFDWMRISRGIMRDYRVSNREK